jgi:hypothetical protein
VRKLFGMAVRRKAPVVLAVVLTLALAGTALAAARGTVLRMGVLNSLTGNYITSFYSVVGGPAYVFRNGSTLLGSSAIRAWAPYGGTPLELYARAGFPVMRVSNAIKVVNLNADLLDTLNTSVANVANTIAVRDGAGAINANLNGNATTATNASNAANANAVNGYPANGLTRVGYMATSATTATSSAAEVTYGSTLTITAPTAGFVRVNGNVTVQGLGCTSGCVVFARVRHIQSGAYSTITEEQVDGPSNYGNMSMDRVFAVAAGTNTFDIRLQRFSGDGTLNGWYGELTGEFSPFGSTGTGTLGSTAQKKVPLKEAP